MTYDTARAHAKAGSRIRRSLWDSFLTWDGERLRFVLPKKLTKELGDEYLPVPIDTGATDWVVV